MSKKSNFISRLIQVEPEEMKGAMLSFFFIFILMVSYMIIRPVRDALPSDWGDVSLAQQWTYTFIFSTIAVAVYNFLASKILIRHLIPGVFAFFALSFLTIYMAYQLNVEVTFLGKVFYVWSSVFALFHISVFWSYTSQHYSKAQSKRVFGFINTGASAGAICGPLLIIFLSAGMSVENILLVTSGALLLTLPMIRILNQYFGKYESHQPDLALSSNPFSGLQEFITNTKLINIAIFIFLFTGISAFLYSIQTNLLVDFTRVERRELLGSVELATNVLTMVIGLFATNRIAQKFGMAVTLSLVPFLVGLLLMLLSANPAIVLVLILQVVRRSGNYAITKPAREILYTAVDLEARFKTKSIIDVAVYRGGDVVWIWVVAFLGDAWLNLGVSSLLWVGAGIAIIWGLTGVIIGKKHEQSEENDAAA